MLESGLGSDISILSSRFSVNISKAFNLSIIVSNNF